MIDLHAHVLPGLDDGPATLEESLALLGAMQAQGVETVVAAVHAYDGRYNATRDAILRAHEELTAALEQAGMTIRVLPSMEVYLSFDILRAAKRNELLGINGGNNLVIELPAREFPAYTERALFELMLAGYRPVLVHPERNRGIQKNPDYMYQLESRGVLGAITAASFLGRFAAEAQALAEEFVRAGVANIVMSDAHDLQGRRPHLPEGLAAARSLGKHDQAVEASLLR